MGADKVHRVKRALPRRDPGQLPHCADDQPAREVGQHGILAVCVRPPLRRQQPLPQRPGKCRVIHRSMVTVAVQVAARIVVGLGLEERLGRDHRHRATDRRGHLMADVNAAVNAGHVRNVNPPGVERVRAEPLRDDRVRPVVEPTPQLRAAVVNDRHLLESPPCIVVARMVGEEKELRFRGVRVGESRPEPLVSVPDMVGRKVAHQADAPGVGGRGEPRHGHIATEQRIDLVEGRCVIAMVRLGREKGRQIDRPDPERRNVVQMRRDTVERQCSESFEQLLMKRSDLLGFGVTSIRQREADCQNTLGVEAGIDLLQLPEAANNRPAPTRSTSARATSTTSNVAQPALAPAIPPRPPSLSRSLRLT